MLVSAAAPDGPVGRQLTWLLRAVADLPWSRRLIQAHFGSGFLAEISPTEINSVLAQTPAPAGASLIGLLWQDPARDPDSLLAVASFGGVEVTVNIAVDGAGLISYLLLTRYQPPPAGWAQDAPAGRQLTWLLRAVADLPWSRRLIQAHFDCGFLAQISPAEINSVLAQAPAPAGASLIRLLWQDPARDPVALQAVAAFGSVMLTVNITVDGAGLISYLLLTPYHPPPAIWAQADRDLAGLAPHASLLAARVSPDGICTPVHQVASSTARPLGSMFKLFILGALAQQVAAGRVSWDQELTVTGELKSAGNPGAGGLQDVPAGTRVPVEQTAAQMISISDNTAADMLIHLVGRPAVQAQDRQWSDHAALNVPFLTTRESFLLKYADPALADEYLRLAPGQRAAFLASAVDPLPLSQAQLPDADTASPAGIDTIEWFGSPDDICRAFAGLQQLAAQPGLAPLGPILSGNDGGIGLHPAQWPTVWYKGGSEPGVLTLGYLATNSNGQTFAVVAMLSDPAAALPPSALLGLLAIVQGAFELVR